MLINFIYFYIFITCFVSVGEFFNSLYLKSYFHKKDIYNVENIISAIFIFGIFTLILNFFFPLGNNLISIFFILLIIYSLFFSFRKIFKASKENYILIFLISIICMYMITGYDGALYHLPHQNFIRDYKIIFGLFNLHERFGTISIYSYISSILWIKDELLILSFFQGIFYFLLFKTILDYIRNKDLTKNAIAISTLIFIPIWIRYAQPSYSLIDFPTGVIFFLSFLKATEIIIFKNFEKDNIKFFLIISALLFSFKSSNLIFIFYFLFVIAIILINKKINIKEFLFFLIFPSLLVFLWILKTYINTGCLLFPVPFVCFEASWSNIELTKSILNEIIIYGQTYLTYMSKESLLSFLNFKIFIFAIISCILGFIIIFISYKILKLKEFNYLGILIVICLSILIIFNLEFVVGFSSLIKSGVIEHKLLGKKIFFRELFLMVLFIFLSIISIYFLFIEKLDLRLSKKSNFNFPPLIFAIFFLSYWLYLSPNPRFGLGYFSVIPLSIVVFFSKQLKDFLKIKKTYVVIFFFIYSALIVNVLVKNMFSINDFTILPSKKIEKIDTINRNDFGVRPVNYCDTFAERNLCWIEKNCYFIEKDAKLEYLKFQYPLIKKITSRNQPKCAKR